MNDGISEGHSIGILCGNLTSEMRSNLLLSQEDWKIR